MTDDDLKRASFDIDLNLRQDSRSSSSWVHVALAVTKTSVTPYIDGEKVENRNIGYAQGASYMRWATHMENIALGNPEQLRSQLSSITLKGCAAGQLTSSGCWASPPSFSSRSLPAPRPAVALAS